MTGLITVNILFSFVGKDVDVMKILFKNPAISQLNMIVKQRMSCGIFYSGVLFGPELDHINTKSDKNVSF